MNAERKKYYQKVVKDIVNKNKGLYFNNELFVIEKKWSTKSILVQKI